MDPISVVIFGTSFGRRVQAVAFQRHSGFRLVAIAGSDPDRTRSAAEELGVRGATDWQRLLADVQPELVSVAAPVHLHHPMMLGALEAGSHVLCEKPTALHRGQAAEMRDAARRNGRVAGINHEFRFFPARQTALDVVRAGGIGVPRRGEILGRYPIWPRPESRDMTWLSDARRGGGVLGALGSHHTDCLRLFFGEPQTVTASVRVDQPWRGAARATADDACTVHYEFAHGATALIDLEACTPYRWERFEIHGAEASLRWDETGYRLWRIVVGREPEEVEIPERHRLTPREGDLPLIAPFGRMIERLRAAIRDGAALEPGFDDAVAVQAALDAARESSVAGVKIAVQIPPPILD